MAHFFELVARIDAAPPMSPEASEDLTGIPVQIDPASNSRHYVVWRGRSHGDTAGSLVREVELRTLTARYAGILILTLADELDVTAGDVIERFPDYAFSPARPEAAPDAPNYLNTQRPWGRLSFGVARDEAERIVCLILDTIDA